MRIVVRAADDEMLLTEWCSSLFTLFNSTFLQGFSPNTFDLMGDIASPVVSNASGGQLPSLSKNLGL